MRESKNETEVFPARLSRQPDLGEKIPTTLRIETRNSSPKRIKLELLYAGSYEHLHERLTSEGINAVIISGSNKAPVYIDIRGHKNIRKTVELLDKEYKIDPKHMQSLRQYAKSSLWTWAADSFSIFDTSDIAEFFSDIVEFFSDMGKAISSLFTKSLEELVTNANSDPFAVHKILAHKGSTAEEKMKAIQSILEKDSNFDLNVADKNGETPLQKLTERDRGGERGYHHNIPAAQAAGLYRPFSLLLLDQLIFNADSDPLVIHKILAHKGSTAQEKIEEIENLLHDNPNFDLNVADGSSETPLQKLTERYRGGEQRSYHHSIPVAQAEELYRSFNLLLLNQLIDKAESDPLAVHKILAHKGSTAQEKIEAIENVLEENLNFDLNFPDEGETPLQKLTERDRGGERGYHHSIPEDQAGALRAFFGQHQPSFIATVTSGLVSAAASHLFRAGVGNNATSPEELQPAQSSDSTIPPLQSSSQANSSSSSQSADSADQPNSSWMKYGGTGAALVMGAGVMGLLSVTGVGVGLAAIAVAATRGQSATPTSPSGETQHTQNSWWGGMFSPPRYQEQGQPSSHNTLPTLRN